MFNNIIYFLVVILVYNFSFPNNAKEPPFFISLVMLIFTWAAFAYYCRLVFRKLIERLKSDQWPDGVSGAPYHNLVFKLSVLAIFLFVLDVYIFHLKYWLQLIPFVKQLTVLENLIAVSLFLFYLSTVWFFAHPAYQLSFHSTIARDPFVRSNIRLNFPILFPYLSLTFIHDLVVLGPWDGLKQWLDSYEGQLIFFSIFLLALMVFMPLLIQRWWGCSSFKPTDKLRELKSFLKEKGFKYRDILSWPIFEGRMITAGIMGIVPKYRYILVTDSLMETLSVEELKAVLAHEMGHAKYRHLLFYIIFLIGYMFISFGLIDLFYVYLVNQPEIIKLFSQDGLGSDLFYLLLAMPILTMMLVYFRYVMGFFMRNFERQADLYSAVVMKNPVPTISSLEKIAFYGGKIRDLPSWHHFSIKQRVEYLWRIIKEKDLMQRHNRFLFFSFSLYLLAVFGFGTVLNFTPIKAHLEYGLLKGRIQKSIEENYDNVEWLVRSAGYLHSLKKLDKAKELYERVLSLDPDQAEALNGLAWLLLKTPDMSVRDPERALSLALRAVAKERLPEYLDTLAEAYYQLGDIQQALAYGKEALGKAKNNVSHYKRQYEKFKKNRGGLEKK
jgi:Zn-dependent protease with chaperone function